MSDIEMEARIERIERELQEIGVTLEKVHDLIVKTDTTVTLEKVHDLIVKADTTIAGIAEQVMPTINEVMKSPLIKMLGVGK